MVVFPPITVENKTNAIKIYYTIPVFVSKTNKDQSHHYLDTVYVRTNYTRNYTHSDTAISFIRIYTDYTDAWLNSLIYDDSGVLWEYYDNGYIDVSLDSIANPTRVEITNGTKNIDVELTIVEIGAQVGSGIVI